MSDIATVTDMDGVMLFSRHLHFVEELSALENGILKVRDDSGYWFDAYKLTQKIGDVGFYFYVDTKTVELGRELTKNTSMVMATGARYGTMRDRVGVFDFYDWYVLENGLVVADSNLQTDNDWINRIKEYKPEIQKTIAELKNYGLKLDIEGRQAMIRVRYDYNDDMSWEDFKNFFRDYAEELEERGLKLERNLGHMDILPEIGGKLAAIQYVLERKLNFPKNNFRYIGDDKNDVDPLEAAIHGYVLSSGNHDVVRWARNYCANISVTSLPYSRGINEVFEEILQNPNLR